MHALLNADPPQRDRDGPRALLRGALEPPQHDLVVLRLVVKVPSSFRAGRSVGVFCEEAEGRRAAAAEEADRSAYEKGTQGDLVETRGDVETGCIGLGRVRQTHIEYRRRRRTLKCFAGCSNYDVR